MGLLAKIKYLIENNKESESFLNNKKDDLIGLLTKWFFQIQIVFLYLVQYGHEEFLNLNR